VQPSKNKTRKPKMGRLRNGFISPKKLGGAVLQLPRPSKS